MGHKNLKKHYRIGHTVCVTDKGICIGSPYIHDLIVISLTGEIIKSDDGRVNQDLRRYMVDFIADPEKLKEVVQSKDVFKKSISVYTYNGGEIIEEQCEKLEWPNVTHAGHMMYENTYSADKNKVVKWAKREAECSIELWGRRIEERKKELSETEALLAKSKSDLEKLKTDYP